MIGNGENDVEDRESESPRMDSDGAHDHKELRPVSPNAWAPVDADDQMDEESSEDSEGSMITHPDPEADESLQNVEFFQWAVDNRVYNFQEGHEAPDEDLAEASPD